MSSFPETRLRRLRRTGALRSLVRETKLDRSDFVYPLFVGPSSQANDELPALGRFSVDDLSREAEELLGLGLSAVILFGIPEEKTRARTRTPRTGSSSERSGGCASATRISS